MCLPASKLLNKMIRWMAQAVRGGTIIKAPSPNPTVSHKPPSTPNRVEAAVDPNPMAPQASIGALPSPGSGPSKCNLVSTPNPFPTGALAADCNYHHQGDDCPPRSRGTTGIPQPPNVLATNLGELFSPASCSTVPYNRVSVPKYNGKFNFIDFQCQFECIAEDHQWTYEEMGKNLSLCLTDEALSILPTIKRTVRRDYGTLCEALMSLHNIPGGEGLLRNELHEIIRRDGQDPNKFGRELRYLARQAYPEGGLPESALVQFFIQGLNDPQMAKQIGLQEPDTLSEAIRLACYFEAYTGCWPWIQHGIHRRWYKGHHPTCCFYCWTRYRSRQNPVPSNWPG